MGISNNRTCNREAVIQLLDREPGETLLISHSLHPVRNNTTFQSYEKNTFFLQVHRNGGIFMNQYLKLETEPELLQKVHKTVKKYTHSILRNQTKALKWRWLRHTHIQRNIPKKFMKSKEGHGFPVIPWNPLPRHCKRKWMEQSEYSQNHNNHT